MANSKKAFEKLKGILGEELYSKVLEEMAGTTLYFPTNHEWHDKELRNISLREDYYCGRYSVGDLAQKYDISISRVYKIIESYE